MNAPSSVSKIDIGQLRILQHSLGVGDFGDKPSHRNHFVTGEGSKDFACCQTLVAAGLMTRREPTALTGGDYCYLVTKAGVSFVAEHSPQRPPEPKLTRSQKNYRRWLEADCGLSFAEWMGFGKKPASRGTYT